MQVILIPAATLLSVARLMAATVDIVVVDRDGEPVPDVVVYVLQGDDSSDLAPAGTSAIMDQFDRAFMPHLLVVQTGTSVEFPNSDTVAHHVYSFSHPNQFKLPIYKGDVHPPVTFDHSGVVTLGCNIHDNMLGFILVVDSPTFSQTNQGGRTTLSVDNVSGSEVRIWSPRIRDRGANLAQTIQSAGASATEVRFELQTRLRPAHNQHSDTISWKDY